MPDKLKCPMCNHDNGYKQTDDGYLWFKCPDCGYITHMAHYKGEMKNK